MDQGMSAIYRKAAEALAQGQLPEYTEGEREQCVRAFEFLKESVEGGAFFLHKHGDFFPKWLTWMNAGLTKISSGTASLRLAENRRAIVFLLVKEGEVKQLLLRPNKLKPFEFVSSPPEVKSEDWPEW